MTINFPICHFSITSGFIVNLLFIPSQAMKLRILDACRYRMHCLFTVSSQIYGKSLILEMKTYNIQLFSLYPFPKNCIEFLLQYNPVKSDSQGTEKVGLT